MSKSSKVQRLHNRGFDESYYIPSFDGGYWKVKCSQCEALVINGIACHETGCPNNPKNDQDDQDDQDDQE